MSSPGGTKCFPNLSVGHHNRLQFEVATVAAQRHVQASECPVKRDRLHAEQDFCPTEKTLFQASLCRGCQSISWGREGEGARGDNDGNAAFVLSPIRPPPWATFPTVALALA